MSDQSVNIKVKAQNQASQTFKDISRDGEQIAVKLEGAGNKGAAAFGKWKDAAAATALAIGSFGLIASRAAGQAEAAEARLTGAFANANIEIEAYRAAIDSASNQALRLAFDDEDATDALAKIVGATKDAEQAFAGLRLAQDIARQEQISLAAAANIVESAYLGKLRGLQSVGIAIDETTTKEEALAAAQAKFAGAAEAYAATGEATFERWGNTAENALEAVGSKLTDIQGPLLALSAAGGIASGLKGVWDEVGKVEGATGKLVGSLGTAGLYGAAALAAGGVAYLAYQAITSKDAFEAAADSAENLNEYLIRLAAAGKDAAFTAPVKSVADEFNLIAREGAKATDQIADLREQLLAANQSLTEARNYGDPAMVDQAQATVDAINQQIDALNRFAASGDQIGEIEKAISTLFSQPGIDAAKAGEAVQYYFDLFQSGQISIETLIDYLNTDATETWYRYADGATAAAASLTKYTEDQLAASAATIEGSAALTANSALSASAAEANAKNAAAADAAAVNYQQLSNTMEGMNAIAAESITLLNEQAEATLAWSAAQVQGSSSVIANSGLMGAAQDAALRRTLANIRGSQELEQAYASLSDTAEMPSRPISDMTAALDAQTEQGQRAIEMLQQYAAAVDQVPALANTAAANLAAGAAGAGAALGDAFRVAVGNTDSIGNQAGQVDDWARSLINVQGAYGKIDDLLASGAISQDDWNAAQDAGNRIFAATANIQEDVLAIQAKQAPLIADATQEQEKYLDLISKLPAEQQQVALAYMDTSTAMKAQQLQALAIAAAHGELGSKGKESAASIIEGAAAADPYLKSILEDMGLITTEDGEVKINYDSVSDAKSELGDLTAVLGDLITVLEQAFNVNVTTNAGDTRAELEGVVGLLNDLDGRSVTYYVNAAGNGVTVGNPNGPGIEQLAGGGMVRARLGEMGGEVVSLAGGGTAYAPTDGIYNVPAGSYVHTAPVSRNLTPGANMGGITVPITINGNVYGMDDLETQVANKLAPALEAALRERRRSKGMRVA